VARIFTRDGERLTCEIRPEREGSGFELICSQDGEDHVEHYPLKSQAEARRSRIAENLLHDGWSIAL
jgi:hypothetical protein